LHAIDHWHSVDRSDLITGPIVSLPTPHALIARLVRAGHIRQPDIVRGLSGGRTNAVWRITCGSRNWVLKLYASAGQTPLFPNDPTAERICLTHLAGQSLAPKLCAAGASEFGPWVLYTFLDGSIWREGTADVARALRALHSQSCPMGLRHAPNGSDDLESQTEEILARCGGSQADALRLARPEGKVAPTISIALLHGDPVPGNLVLSETGLAFIDWQCPALGDPCEDLAIFLSPAMQHLYRGHALSPREVRNCLHAYGAPDVTSRYDVLRPWYHRRMAAYCIWRVQTGATEYAAGLDLELAALQGCVNKDQVVDRWVD
jgi:aminoglycoside phosphotransferase (APT) family kinase protein